MRLPWTLSTTASQTRSQAACPPFPASTSSELRMRMKVRMRKRVMVMAMARPRLQLAKVRPNLTMMMMMVMMMTSLVLRRKATLHWLLSGSWTMRKRACSWQIPHASALWIRWMRQWLMTTRMTMRIASPLPTMCCLCTATTTRAPDT